MSSIPTTFFACALRHMPIAPVPQHISNSTVLESIYVNSAMSLSIDVKTDEFTWKKANGETLNL